MTMRVIREFDMTKAPTAPDEALELSLLRALVNEAITRCRCGLFATQSAPTLYGRFYCDDCGQGHEASPVFYHQTARAMNNWLKEYSTDWLLFGDESPTRPHG